MFRKYFGVMLFLAGFLASSFCYGDTNLVSNPGFEDSNNTSWTGRGCTFAYTTEQKHSGAQCGKASSRTDTWQGIKQSMLGKMQNGKTYHVSGWVKFEKSVSMITFTLSAEQQDDKGTQYFNIGTQLIENPGSGEWVQMSGNFTPKVTGTLKVLDIYFEGPYANVNFYVDDVNVVDTSAAAPAAPKAPSAPNTPPAQPKPAQPKPAEPNAPAKAKTSINNPAGRLEEIAFSTFFDQNMKED